MFLAHILAGNPDWQNWYDANRSSPLWEVCGFEQVPSWQTTYLRFAELEAARYVPAFTDAANFFIRRAARAEPRAFRFTHTDGTPAHSHAKLEHACPSQAFCEACTGRKPHRRRQAPHPTARVPPERRPRPALRDRRGRARHAATRNPPCRQRHRRRSPRPQAPHDIHT